MVLMISSPQTEALVALENSAPDVLFETFPGTRLAIWPLLRWPLIRSMSANEREPEPAADDTSGPARPALKPRKSVRRLGWEVAQRTIPGPYSPKRARNRDLLFLVSGSTQAQTDAGLKNWLIGDFAAAEAGRSAILQDRGIKRKPSPLEKPAFDATFSLDRDIFIARQRSTDHPMPESDATAVRAVVRETYRNLPFVVDEQRIARTAEWVVNRGLLASHLTPRFARIIDRLRPKAAFVQTAVYLNQAALIAVLKDRGAKVIEPQHGWIGPSHGAYNFGAAITRPELARYMPDTLLTFGDFWSDSVRFPGEKIAIGKPHLEQTAAQAPALADREKTVLVVSNAYQEDVTTRLVMEIRNDLPADWRVLFRPHPVERALVAQRYPRLIEASGVEIDTALDVNASLGNARAVFGYFSTVLYEALAFGCDVFVFDSPMADLCADREIFGERVTDRDSVRAAIGRILDPDARETGDRARLLESIWKPHAVDNFRAFVGDEVDSRGR
jgi:hypothetical protein